MEAKADMSDFELVEQTKATGRPVKHLVDLKRANMPVRQVAKLKLPVNVRSETKPTAQAPKVEAPKVEVPKTIAQKKVEVKAPKARAIIDEVPYNPNVISIANMMGGRPRLVINSDVAGYSKTNLIQWPQALDVNTEAYYSLYCAGAGDGQLSLEPTQSIASNYAFITGSQGASGVFVVTPLANTYVPFYGCTYVLNGFEIDETFGYITSGVEGQFSVDVIMTLFTDGLPTNSSLTLYQNGNPIQSYTTLALVAGVGELCYIKAQVNVGVGDQLQLLFNNTDTVNAELYNISISVTQLR